MDKNKLIDENYQNIYNIAQRISKTYGLPFDVFVYTAPTATTARAFCRTLPLTAHGHCAAKYDILDMAR